MHAKLLRIRGRILKSKEHLFFFYQLMYLIGSQNGFFVSLAEAPKDKNKTFVLDTPQP